MHTNWSRMLSKLLSIFHSPCCSSKTSFSFPQTFYSDRWHFRSLTLLAITCVQGVAVWKIGKVAPCPERNRLLFNSLGRWSNSSHLLGGELSPPHPWKLTQSYFTPLLFLNSSWLAWKSQWKALEKSLRVFHHFTNSIIQGELTWEKSCRNFGECEKFQ